jgi:hypothetical protein
MNKLISTFIVILISQLALSQKIKCENFKVGKFIYRSEGLPNIIVIRTETEQKEIIQDSNQEFHEKINWLSDCRYELTYTKAPFQNLIGKSLKIELFDIENNFAKGKATFEESNLEFTVVKIE